MNRSKYIVRLLGLDLSKQIQEKAIRDLYSESDTSIVDDDGTQVKEEVKGAPEVSNVLPNDLLSRDEVAKRYGYTRAAIYWWERHPSGIVHRYHLNGAEQPYYSAHEVEQYISLHGSPNLRATVRTDEKPAPKQIAEFEAVAGAAKRLGLKPQMIEELIDSSRIGSREFYGHTIVSVLEIEALSHGQRHAPDWSIFDNKEWLPLKDAIAILGLSYEEVNRAASHACADGLIANQRIGNLRFVKVADLEQWYINRKR